MNPKSGKSHPPLEEDLPDLLDLRDRLVDRHLCMDPVNVRFQSEVTEWDNY